MADNPKITKIKLKGQIYDLADQFARDQLENLLTEEDVYNILENIGYISSLTDNESGEKLSVDGEEIFVYGE